MLGAGRKLIRRLKGAAIGDEGNATIEFVILFPAIMFIFLSSFELSIYLTRTVLLERALDLNVRLLRLGTITDSATLRDRVCEDSLIFDNCPEAIAIELIEVSTTTWDLPTGNYTCVDRTSEEELNPNFSPGGINDLMVVRACMVLDPFFGTTPYVMELPLDTSGGYRVTAASTFVNEP